ncbi:MAG: hypothetical protein HC847_09025 [Hydrococcus sp. RU_2_2]|nr:hypothetical protein [Hydrococcus sp. RU_2_2]NJR76379.1 hypothetical protein [Scytonema sp. CRU_2_7]
MAESTDGYDKVSEALAKGATAFWKTVFDDLGKGETKTLTGLIEGGIAATITPDDIKNFFDVLGGASMKIDLNPKIVKGTKNIFDSGLVEPGIGVVVDDKDKVNLLVSGSISIGVGISF